jgi:hypothetical protein
MNESVIPAWLLEENPERLETPWNLQAMFGGNLSMQQLRYRSLYSVYSAKAGIHGLRSPS